MFRTMPDKYMALGAAALQVWAMAAKEAGGLEREAVAKRIRGGTFRDTVMGEATFGPDGQLQSRHALFTVQDQKIVVRR
jgi:branched-chain amino acid transport system substrate-binding protein